MGMRIRFSFRVFRWFAAAILPAFSSVQNSSACCPVAADGRAVVNADQTVIMIWDAEHRTQHFIRQASFKSDARDVGFIVPTPSRPELGETGDQAFQRLREITAPPPAPSRGFGIGCAAIPPAATFAGVEVIERKRVAGYDATVLRASSGAELVAWLKNHGYSYSPAVASWAAPYLSGGWMMTALKIAKPDGSSEQNLDAKALRLTFQTDQPLFPYREPESTGAAQKLGISDRLLRIYFISDARYRGGIAGRPWSGKTVWSGDIGPWSGELRDALRLPANSGPATWWLTEFEDRWPYAQAAGDVYFTMDSFQRIQRKAVASQFPLDPSLTAVVALGLLRPFRRKRLQQHDHVLR